MTTRHRIRRAGARGAIAMLALALALALGACTPSNLEIEERTTRSAFKALSGQAASAKPTCSLERVQDGGPQERYEGRCVVHGRSFRMTAFYSPGATSHRTAFTSAVVPLAGNKVFDHTCSWVKDGSKSWRTISPCTTSEKPGF